MVETLLKKGRGLLSIGPLLMNGVPWGPLSHNFGLLPVNTMAAAPWTDLGRHWSYVDHKQDGGIKFDDIVMGYHTLYWEILHMGIHLKIVYGNQSTIYHLNEPCCTCVVLIYHPRL